MVIVETGVWIDLFRDADTPHTKWLRQNKVEKIGLLDLTLCEVLQGANTARLFTSIRQNLTRFSVQTSGGAWLMLASAQNYRTLRGLGITVRSTIDCIIATYCIEHGHELLHQDRDFHPFEIHLGLRVLHPTRLPES